MSQAGPSDPLPAHEASNQPCVDGSARLDDVMPIRTQGGLAMLLSSLVLLVGFVLGMAKIQRSASGAAAVQFRTSDANALQEGMEARLSGFRIGQVDRIQLERDAGVRVSLRIEPAYRHFLGPRSQVRMVQDTLIGSGHLALTPDPSALQGRQGVNQPSRPLLLAYTPPVNLPALLTAVAQSRLPLNRFLNASSRLLEGDLPKVVGTTDSTLAAVRDLASDLRVQAGTSGAELRTTAQATRRTLSVYQDLGRQGIQKLAAADADLRSNGPQLLQSLRRLDALLANLDRLVHRLSRSWLFDLLGDPSRVPEPLGPPPQPTGNGHRPGGGPRAAAEPSGANSPRGSGRRIGSHGGDSQGLLRSACAAGLRQAASP